MGEGGESVRVGGGRVGGWDLNILKDIPAVVMMKIYLRVGEKYYKASISVMMSNSVFTHWCLLISLWIDRICTGSVWWESCMGSMTPTSWKIIT